MTVRERIEVAAELFRQAQGELVRAHQALGQAQTALQELAARLNVQVR